MKRLCLKEKTSSKRGVASLYIVIFATILFGVVTLSFMRIILSEASQSSDDDLSRSAYDAAIAGVEDAKIAVNRYYKCLGTSGADCDEPHRDMLFDNDCTDSDGIGVARYVYGSSYSGSGGDVEVLIQEGATPQSGTQADQAYTCIVVSDTVPDYRGTLTSDTRVKVIPLAVYDGSGSYSSDISTVSTVQFSWYSRLNEGEDAEHNFNVHETDDPAVLYRNSDANGPTIPPTLSLTLISVPSGMQLEEFHSANMSSSYIYSTIIPTPHASNGGDGVNTVSSTDLRKYGNINEYGSKTDNQNKVLPITCSFASEFACTIRFTGMSFNSTDSVFLVAALPYGENITDFSATLCNGACASTSEIVPFTGVQIQVDSTGRTNQLFRRVEVRLDPSDLFFPYPQYELDLGDGGGDDALKKYFWITANCWHSHPDTSSAPSGCPNNKELNPGE